PAPLVKGRREAAGFGMQGLGPKVCISKLWAALIPEESMPADAALEARLRAAQRQLELADRGDALLGEAVGRAVGRDRVALADFIDAREVVVDRAHHAHRTLAVVTVDLERDVHDAAGVHG